jgi:hypothetical protein
MNEHSLLGQGGGSEKPPFAPVALDEDGQPRTICEMCGSSNLDFDGVSVTSAATAAIGGTDDRGP